MKVTGPDLPEASDEPSLAFVAGPGVTVSVTPDHGNGLNRVRIEASEGTTSPHTHPQSDIINLTADLAGKSGVGHGHVLADTTGLQAALDGKAASNVVTDHVALADPHTQYELAVDKGAANGYASLDGATKLPVAQLPAHTHAISDTTGLQTALDGKAASDVVTVHVGLADPHTQYQRESEKGQANGYASLGADGLVPSSQLPVGGGGFAWTATPKQAADAAVAGTSFVNTDLVFTFAANSWYVCDLYLLMQSAAATTGYGFAFDVSAAVTVQALTFGHVLANTGTWSAGDSIADATARGLSSGVSVANVVIPIIGQGVVVSGANTGTARLVVRSEVAAGTTFKAHSAMRVHKIA